MAVVSRLTDIKQALAELSAQTKAFHAIRSQMAAAGPGQQQGVVAGRGCRCTTSVAGQLNDNDRRGLSLLFWTHVNPYGRFYLDMDTRIDLTHLPSGGKPASAQRS